MKKFTREDRCIRFSFGKFKYENQSSKVCRIEPLDRREFFAGEKKTSMERVIAWLNRWLNRIIEAIKNIFLLSSHFK